MDNQYFQELLKDFSFAEIKSFSEAVISPTKLSQIKVAVDIYSTKMEDIETHKSMLEMGMRALATAIDTNTTEFEALYESSKNTPLDETIKQEMSVNRQCAKEATAGFHKLYVLANGESENSGWDAIKYFGEVLRKYQIGNC